MYSQATDTHYCLDVEVQMKIVYEIFLRIIKITILLLYRVYTQSP